MVNLFPQFFLRKVGEEESKSLRQLVQFAALIQPPPCDSDVNTYSAVESRFKWTNDMILGNKCVIWKSHARHANCCYPIHMHKFINICILHIYVYMCACVLSGTREGAGPKVVFQFNLTLIASWRRCCHRHDMFSSCICI